MTTLRCTKAILDEAGISPGSLAVSPSETSTETSPFGDWYVNLFRIERKKCAIFLNVKTLFSFYIVGVKPAELRKLPDLFVSTLISELASMGYSPELIDAIVAAHGSCAVGKTNNRRVTGIMNSVIQTFEFFIWHNGGLSRSDRQATQWRMNTQIWKMIDFKEPIDLWFEILEKVMGCPEVTPRRRLMDRLLQRLKGLRQGQRDISIPRADAIPDVYPTYEQFKAACLSLGMNCEQGTDPAHEPLLIVRSEFHSNWVYIDGDDDTVN